MLRLPCLEPGRLAATTAAGLRDRKFFWGVLLTQGVLFPRLLFFTRTLGVFFGVRLVRIGLLGEARRRFGRSWVSP